MISRTETYKGLGNSQSSSSNVSTARKEVEGGMLGSTKTGNSSGGNNKNRGSAKSAVSRIYKTKGRGEVFPLWRSIQPRP